MLGKYFFIDYELSGYHVSIEDLVAAGRGTIQKSCKVNTMGFEVRSSLGLGKINGLLPWIFLIHFLIRRSSMAV